METRMANAGRTNPKKRTKTQESAVSQPSTVKTVPGPRSSHKKTAKQETTFQRRRRGRMDALFSNYELVTLVCHLHVSGATVKEIVHEVGRKFPTAEIKREDPNWIIRRAALMGWLVFRPPHEETVETRISELFPKIEKVKVVSSAEVEVVAGEAARMLLQMLRKFDRNREVVHVGLAGGHTLRAVMQALASEMIEPVTELPKVVHFHALAAGFNPDDPTTNPNSFVTFFDGRLVPSEIRFTGLSAPAIVGPKTFEELKGFDDIQDAFDDIQNIDIFVTSGTTWHADGVLRKRMVEEDQETLEGHGIIGDLLWRPISEKGPIEASTTRRAFTLIELKQLKNFIREGKQVLVTLAPCGLCGELKGILVKCILEQELATHLVIDTRSAGKMLGKLSRG